MVNPPMGLAGRNYAFGLTTTLNASWLIFDGFARYLNTFIGKSEFSQANYLRTLNQQAVANYSFSMLMGYSDGVLPKNYCRPDS